MKLNEITKGLSRYYEGAPGTKDVIENAALAAALTDAAGSLIPVIAIPATIFSCFAAVWLMYGKLAEKLGISLKENALKLMARAALSNIVANAGGFLVGSVLGMLVPGVSVLTSAMVVYITVYLAGLVFLSSILKLAQHSADPHSFSDMSEDELKRVMRESRVTAEDVAGAKSAYQARQ